MKLLYKLSIVTIVVMIISMIGWCIRKRYVEKFEDNDTHSIISSFSRTVDQMLMRQTMDEIEIVEDDKISENNSA